MTLQLHYFPTQDAGAQTVSRCKVYGETAREQEVAEIALKKGMVEVECERTFGDSCSDQVSVKTYVTEDCVPPAGSFARPGCVAITSIGDTAPAGAKIFRSLGLVTFRGEL